jgi:tetratricopeptide (TPR) repeat protein
VLLCALSAFGCGSYRPAGVGEYYGGGRVAAEEVYLDKLQSEPNSRALYLLLLGNLELDRGNVREAREYFIEATRTMESLEASGEFAATVGAESTKEYKGDPYERLMAWWYLGLLDFMLGDYDMALPSFKSAVVADGGGRDPRFYGDTAAAYLLLGMTHQALGDTEKAIADFKDAARANSIRGDSEVIFGMIRAASAEVAALSEESPPVHLAADLMAAAVPDAVAGQRDIAAALTVSSRAAIDKLNDLESGDEEPRVLGRYSSAEVGEYVKSIESAARERLNSGKQVGKNLSIEAMVDGASSPRNNFFVVVGLGRGPHKHHAGRYEHFAAIARAVYPERYARVIVDGRDFGRTETVEDVFFQAVTRGGRAMDAVLAGKAFLKSIFVVAAADAFREAEEEDTSSDEWRDSFFEGLFWGSLALLVRSEADVRSWETLPDKIQVFSAGVEPGVHTVEVAFFDERSAEIPGMRMRWENVRFAAGTRTVLYVRGGLGGAWRDPPKRYIPDLVSTE